MSAAKPAAPITPFVITGVVEKGDQRGRTLGIPTANVTVARGHAFPDEGVYAATVTLGDGSRHIAAVSIGRRPTFYADGFELCEAHLLDFSGDLYDQAIDVVLTHHIRGQVRFDSVDALIAQMRHDCDLVRQTLQPPIDPPAPRIVERSRPIEPRAVRVLGQRRARDQR